MQILKEAGTDWREIRWISKFYMDQGVKIGLDQKEMRLVKTGRRLRQIFYLPPILFNLYKQPVAIETLEGSGDFKIGQVIGTVQYAYDVVLLA